MQQHILDIDQFKKPQELKEYIHKTPIEAGDLFKKLYHQPRQPIELFSNLYFIGSILFNKRKNNKAIQELIDTLSHFQKQKDAVDALRNFIGKKLNIELNLIYEPYTSENKENREDWQEIAHQSLNKAFAQDEPDISNLPLKEKNPAFKPWWREKL